MGTLSVRCIGIVGVTTLLVASLLTGCSSTGVKKQVLESTNKLKQGPQQKPFRSITNFSSALRCMDDFLISNGVRDVSVLVEDLLDQTKKVSAGTKDMLISAVSDMTRRSRAIRLIAYGQDSGNLIGFLQAAERKNAYAIVPQYDVRGSISQFDDNIAKKSVEFGLSAGEDFSIGSGRSGAATILGVDLSVLNTSDLSIVPGVISRNSVLIYKSGKGLDSDAQYKKFGITFGATLSEAEGNSQALRNLVELAAIELFGKLTKIPYWQCLGVDHGDEMVKAEIADWFYAMEADGAEMILFLQSRLRMRGYYNGTVDGAGNPQLAEAVINQRVALGMSGEVKADLPLFTQLLTGATDHQSFAVITPSASPKPIQITITTANNARVHKRGELVNLSVKTNRDAYVYCFIHDEHQRIQRFFPNRFIHDALVPAERPLQLPGAMRFQLLASENGKSESVACFATPSDTPPNLPETVRGTDFESLPAKSLEQVQQAFAAGFGQGVGQAYYNIEISN